MSTNHKSTREATAISNPFKKAYDYFEDVKLEFQKIQWTEGAEVRDYAKIVVISTFVFGMAIYIADLVIQRVLFGLEGIFKWLLG